MDRVAPLGRSQSGFSASRVPCTARAFVFVAGGRTSANELEGFVMGTSAVVLLVGAILAHGLGRLRAEFRIPTSPQ